VKKAQYLILISSILILISCGDDDSNKSETPRPVDTSSFIQSIQGSRESFIQYQGNNTIVTYSFTIDDPQILAPNRFRNLTILKQENDQVIERSYQKIVLNNDGSLGEIVESYAESSLNGDLGSHLAGAKSRAILELYDECEQILQEKSDSTRFEINIILDQKGLISECSYLDKVFPDAIKLGIVGLTIGNN
jgi:hypothetical protein